MPSRHDPYIPCNPGDLITAESTNEMQVLIKEDIAKQTGDVQKALDDFKAQPVDADTFDGKTPDQWTKIYDERYFSKAEGKNGLGMYRRYFKSLNRVLAGGAIEPGIIEHKMGRFPLVELCELAPFGNLTPAEVSDEVGNQAAVNALRFIVYYANARDKAANKLQTRGNDVKFWGDPLATFMDQFKLALDGDQQFDDLLNDLWGKMFDPGDDQDFFDQSKYTVSAYIAKNMLGKSVKELQKGGQWDDLYIAMRPQLFAPGAPALPRGDMAVEVNVFHLNQNMIEINTRLPIDLMVIVRS